MDNRTTVGMRPIRKCRIRGKEEQSQRIVKGLLFYDSEATGTWGKDPAWAPLATHPLNLQKYHVFWYMYRDWEEFFCQRDYGPLLDHIKGPF